MIFRQLFDPKTFTYTYILACEKTKEAIIIDPVNDCFERDKKLIKELSLNLKYILETHTHVDHISGSFNLKAEFPEAKSGLPEFYGSGFVDINVCEDDVFCLGEIYLKTINTPGHTSGSVSYYTEEMVFTGDSLLIRSCGRTDCHSGNPESLYNSVKDKLFALPENTIVYPGHDYHGQLSSTIREEKLYNPLFSGTTKKEFENIMTGYSPKDNIQAVITEKKCRQEMPVNNSIVKRHGFIEVGTF